MNKLVFEKFGDLRTTYPYLCVYMNAIDGYPFLEVHVTDDKELLFRIISKGSPIEITLGQWKEIMSFAEDFKPKVIADEGQTLN